MATIKASPLQDEIENRLFEFMEDINFTKGVAAVHQSRQLVNDEIDDLNAESDEPSARLKACKILFEKQEEFLDALKETKNTEHSGTAEEVEQTAMKILCYNFSFHKDNGDTAIEAWKGAAGDLDDYCKDMQNLSLKQFFADNCTGHKYIKNAEQEWMSAASQETPSPAANKTEASTPKKDRNSTVDAANETINEDTEKTKSWQKTTGKVAGAAIGATIAGTFAAKILNDQSEDNKLISENKSPDKPRSKLLTFAKVAMVAMGVALTAGFIANLMGREMRVPAKLQQMSESKYFQNTTSIGTSAKEGSISL